MSRPCDTCSRRPPGHKAYSGTPLPFTSTFSNLRDLNRALTTQISCLKPELVQSSIQFHFIYRMFCSLFLYSSYFTYYLCMRMAHPPTFRFTYWYSVLPVSMICYFNQKSMREQSSVSISKAFLSRSFQMFHFWMSRGKNWKKNDGKFGQEYVKIKNKETITTRLNWPHSRVNRASELILFKAFVFLSHSLLWINFNHI